MSILVGSKSHVALEYVESEDEDLGNIYLYVGNERFGEDSYVYEAKDILQHVINHLKSHGNFPELIKCPAQELFRAFDLAIAEDVGIDDTVDLEALECGADKYLPNFMRVYAGSADLDSCIFRYAPYIFDQCTIITISSGNEMRLYARDDKTKTYTDIVTSTDKFFRLWKELADIVL